MKNLIILSLLFTYSKWIHSQEIEESCDHKIYCQGDILDHVQRARLFSDSKSFVDMRLLHPVEQTIEDFDELLKNTENEPTKEDLEKFVESHFSSTGEFENWSLTDFNSNPDFLNHLENDAAVKHFAKELISKWPSLARRVKSEVFNQQDLHSLIALPNGFIVPGGRFRETYYWDSYWIIKGLLLSEMSLTAKNMLDNFIYLIEKFGFIPNGSRVYYLNRSQPPLFLSMVKLYMDATSDITWLRQNIETLEKEMVFWLEKRTVNFTKNGLDYTLAHYATKSATPRPESYYEDLKTASDFQTNEDKQRCYSNLKSGAESGWDFSSRWLSTSNLSSIETQEVIPVDLNSFLCRSFMLLHEFFKQIGGSERAKFWHQKYLEWKKAIDDVLYDQVEGIWYDYHKTLHKNNKKFYPSNLTPLWAQIYDDEESILLGDAAVQYLEHNNITTFVGGIPSSLEETGEQWDFPNAWPPLQSIVVLGLYNSGSSKAKELANNLAKNTVNSYMKGYETHGQLYEKYDAVHSGEYGFGGEYTVQVGFGWSNGVALEFIDQFFKS